MLLFFKINNHCHVVKHTNPVWLVSYKCFIPSSSERIPILSLFTLIPRSSRLFVLWSLDSSLLPELFSFSSGTGSMMLSNVDSRDNRFTSPFVVLASAVFESRYRGMKQSDINRSVTWCGTVCVKNSCGLNLCYWSSCPLSALEAPSVNLDKGEGRKSVITVMQVAFKKKKTRPGINAYPESTQALNMSRYSAKLYSV